MPRHTVHSTSQHTNRSQQRRVTGPWPTPETGQHSWYASPDSGRNGDPAQNRAAVELSLPTPTDMLSVITEIVLYEMDDPTGARAEELLCIPAGERAYMNALVERYPCTQPLQGLEITCKLLQRFAQDVVSCGIHG